MVARVRSSPVLYDDPQVARPRLGKDVLVAPEQLHEQGELVRPKLVRPLTGRNLWVVMRNCAVCAHPNPNPMTLTLTLTPGPNSLILTLILKALIFLSLTPFRILSS